jgi:hypothetical protein
MLPRSKLALLLVVCLAGCDNWSDAQVAETKRRGDIICRALEEYRVRTGKVSDNLKQLQRDFLPEIPEPTVGKRAWTYETYQSGRSYNLSVAIRRESEPLLQTQSPEDWSYDTK